LTPAQIDGEPFMLEPGDVTIQFLEQATMLRVQENQ
jgi:hypothetical protein